MDSSSSVTVHKLLQAATRGDLKRLKKLVNDNGEENSAKIKDVEGCTALHLAAGEGRTHICRHLIEILKFDVDLQDDKGYTPLYHTIKDRHEETAKYLVKSGASMTITDYKGCTPLHIAASHGGGKDMLELFVSKGGDIEAISDEGGTPLTHAAAAGDSDAVKFLLNNKAEFNPVNTVNNPIMEASSISLECTKLLVKASSKSLDKADKADINLFFTCSTPLHEAAVAGKVDIIKYLLKEGANPNVLNYLGITPLEMAAKISEKFEVVSLLLSVTTPISGIPNWSVKGIMNYVKSEDFHIKTTNAQQEFIKLGTAKAEEAIKKEEYWVALNWYKRMEEVIMFDAIIYLYKSKCFALLGRTRASSINAERCCFMGKVNQSMKPDNLEIKEIIREADKLKLQT